MRYKVRCLISSFAVGVIQLKSELDYEAVRPQIHSLSITVDDGTSPVITETLTINILDVYEELTVVNLPNEVILDIKDETICNSPFVSDSSYSI